MFGRTLSSHFQTPSGLLPPDKLRLLNENVLAACGPGAKDGGLASDRFLSNPMACAYDPVALRCPVIPGPGKRPCLSYSEVEVAKLVYGGPHLTEDPTVQLYPGLIRGSEGLATNWLTFEGVYWFWQQPLVIPLPPPLPPPAGALGINLVFDAHFKAAFGNQWTVQDFDFSRGKVRQFDTNCARDANNVVSDVCNLTDMYDATKSDLKAFKKRGGKLIVYHGLSDGVISPEKTVEFFNNVVKDQGSIEEAQKFARLFLVPGMTHCGGGPGPNALNVVLDASAPEDSDIVSALDAWVTKGKAPERIVATKFYVNDNFFSGVAMSRPLCVYPKQAHYKGSGKTSDPDNFVCK
jgi:feruloyl esterase